MEWQDVKSLGPIGVFLVALFLLAKDYLKNNHVAEMRRLDIEDKKADAFSAALVSIGGKVDAHATADIASHTEMATGLAELHGKVDEVLAARDRTPVEGVPRVTPATGVPTGYYSHPRRPGTKGGG